VSTPDPETPNAAGRDEETPYVPPAKAYQRPVVESPVVERPVVERRSATPSASSSEPTQALPVVVGTVPAPQPPAAQPSAAQPPAAQPSAAQPPGVQGPAGATAPHGSWPGAPAGGSGSTPPPLLGELVGDGQPSRVPKALLGLGIGVVVLAGLYTSAQWVYADRVPTGTQVAGVEVGGLTREEAVRELESGLAARAREPMRITAGTAQATLDPAAAGLRFDARATAASLTGFSFDPSRLWAHLFGGQDAHPVVDVDQATLDAAVAGLAESLATDPVDGTVSFVGGQPVATPATEGSTVVPDAAAQTLAQGWLRAAGPFELPTEPVAPAITQEETDAALAQAKQIISAPVTVAVGGQSPELPTDALATVASFQPVDGALQVVFDGGTLVTAVVDRTSDLLAEPEDAHFEFHDGAPVVVGGAPGSTIDPAALAAAVQEAALGTERTAAVELTERAPERSREALEALGVTEVVASFSTPLTSEPIRTKNLHRGAELLTGTLVKPGEVFSLTEALSPISLANGYFAAGIISNGLHTQGVGGGLSQMATTTFNAVQLAGFEDVEHRPHSVWFRRYPPGREATIADGSLDMRFRNNSPYGAVMQSWLEGGELHVQIWSTRHFTVDQRSGDKTNIVPTTPIHKSGPGCEPYPGGEAGFSITNYRTVRRGDTVVIDEKFSWTYKPDNPVICDPPAAPPEAAAPDAGGQ